MNCETACNLHWQWTIWFAVNWCSDAFPDANPASGLSNYDPVWYLTKWNISVSVMRKVNGLLVVCSRYNPPLQFLSLPRNEMTEGHYTFRMKVKCASCIYSTREIAMNGKACKHDLTKRLIKEASFSNHCNPMIDTTVKKHPTECATFRRSSSLSMNTSDVDSPDLSSATGTPKTSTQVDIYTFSYYNSLVISSMHSENR